MECKDIVFNGQPIFLTEILDFQLPCDVVVGVNANFVFLVVVAVVNSQVIDDSIDRDDVFVVTQVEFCFAAEFCVFSDFDDFFAVISLDDWRYGFCVCKIDFVFVVDKLKVVVFCFFWF